MFYYDSRFRSEKKKGAPFEKILTFLQLVSFLGEHT